MEVIYWYEGSACHYLTFSADGTTPDNAVTSDALILRNQDNTLLKYTDNAAGIMAVTINHTPGRFTGLFEQVNSCKIARTKG